ncbi:hypothetical protein [Streptomyces massasporeus]|uniref:hypothetical protein n=1 Tax=Streptomyces massasporeus TaxID=67324 RepID=UPI0036BFF92C
MLDGDALIFTTEPVLEARGKAGDPCTARTVESSSGDVITCTREAGQPAQTHTDPSGPDTTHNNPTTLRTDQEVWLTDITRRLARIERSVALDAERAERVGRNAAAGQTTAATGTAP